MAQERKVEELLARYRAFITYVPLRTEVPFRDYLDIPPATYEIAPRASLDPEAEIVAAIHAVGTEPTAILIPGRAFDATGTRHGQGGGWYDRFLAKAPTNWYRIGFCYDHQFSEAPLTRQSWDQVMDAVCVVRGGTLAVYETKAR